MSDQYAVIGHPIGHSKSPLIHSSFARATGQDLRYTAIEAPLDGFAATVRSFRSGGGLGLNITAPFKLQAFELATDRLERAQQAGAANAIKFDGERIVADNFDGIGLVNDIQRNLGLPLTGRRVLVLGAGGAARGVLAPFLAQKPATLLLCNRDADKARSLARQFGGGALEGCGFADLGGSSFDIVVNATSAGLGSTRLALPADVFNAGGLAYELAYGKGLTPFLQQAQDAGVARLADGVGMLVEQAAEAFAWWRGVRPDTGPVIKAMKVPLT